MKKGWERKRLDAVLEIKNGKNQREVKSEKGPYPIYGSGGIMGSATEYLCEAGCTIIGRKGSINNPIFTPSRFWIVDTAFGLSPKPGLDAKFLHYFCLSYDFSMHNRGTTIPSLVKTELLQIRMPVPPLPEQLRIVGILDEALAAIANAKAQTERNLQNARALFQVVLSTAVMGDITQEWRNSNHAGKTSAAVDLKELLLQISMTERKSIRGEETTGNETITGALPGEWRHASIEMLFNLIDYRGKTASRSETGRRLITAKNIKMGYLSDEPVTFISEEQYKKWMVRGFPKLGDILFVTEGHTMGFVALNTRTDDFALAQRTITLQPPVPFNTKYFFYFMLSSHFQNLVKVNATGAAAVGMKASKFRSLPLPFPPFVEQQIIADQLDVLSAETRRLEALYRRKLESLEELKKSLLHRAFEGEL